MFWSYSVPKPLLRDIIQKAECNMDCSMPHKVYILGSIMAFYWGLWYTVVSNSLYWILPIGSVQWYLELNSFKFGDVWQTNFVPTIDILLKIHTYLIYYMEATLKKKRAFPWSNTHQCFIFVKWHTLIVLPFIFHLNNYILVRNVIHRWYWHNYKWRNTNYCNREKYLQNFWFDLLKVLLM